MADITFAWDANPGSEHAGYKMHWGTASRIYTFSQDVGAVAFGKISGLADGTWYVATTAYDNDGRESGFSDEATVIVAPNTTPPAVPKGFHAVDTEGVSSVVVSDPLIPDPVDPPPIADVPPIPTNLSVIFEDPDYFLEWDPVVSTSYKGYWDDPPTFLSPFDKSNFDGSWVASEFTSGARVRTALSPPTDGQRFLVTALNEIGESGESNIIEWRTPVSPPPPPEPGTFLSDGFETGDFSEWDQAWTLGDVTINTDPAFVRTGANSAKIHYVVGSGQPLHADSNRWFRKDLDGATHVTFTGWVYFGTPLNTAIQRKLLYFKDSEYVKFGISATGWAIIISSHSFDMVLALAAPRDGVFNSADPTVIWNLFKMQPNQWYKLAIEINANTPGAKDGFIKVWVNDGLVLDKQSMNIRGNSTFGLDRVEVGRQVDRTDGILVDEYRYWDDIAITIY